MAATKEATRNAGEARVVADSRRADSPYKSVYASAARTATPTKNLLKFPKGKRAMKVIIDCTADPALASVVFTIQGYAPISGKYYTILASAAIAAVGTTVLTVSPDLAASANVVARDVMPPDFAIAAVHADADSITYSVECIFLESGFPLA